MRKRPYRQPMCRCCGGNLEIFTVKREEIRRSIRKDGTIGVRERRNSAVTDEKPVLICPSCGARYPFGFDRYGRVCL